MPREGRPVALYDRSGKLVKRFPTIAQAAHHLNIAPPCVHRCVREPYHAVQDFYVRRIDDGCPETIEIVPTPSRKKRTARKAVIAEVKRELREARVVIELDPRTKQPTGREFATSSAAAKHYGVSRQMVSLVLVHPETHKSVKGVSLAYKVA